LDKFNIPVVLFVFKRLETVKMIVEQIKKVQPSVIYLFSDAARPSVENEIEKVKIVREYVQKAVDWECKKKFYFADINKGCDKNIRDGLDRVFKEEPFAIIFEDDAVPELCFFSYCEDLLNKYKDNKKIQYIAGFNGIGNRPVVKYDYTFGKTVPMSGAFATWADRWNECDFEMRDWPTNKKNHKFDDVFFSKEMRRIYTMEFDKVYSRKTTSWDFIFEHDMLNKDRMVIAPKGNFATSYGYVEGAFHPQKEYATKKLIGMMTSVTKSVSFPLSHPPIIERDTNYDRERQKQSLGVRGGFVYRHVYEIYIVIKDWCYEHFPSVLWKAAKRLAGR